MLFRPSESSKRITEFYRRYLLTTFSTNKEEYNKKIREALEKDKAIADGPYISMVDPYKKGKTLKELFSNGAKSKKDKGNAKEDQKTNKDKKDSKPTKGQSSEIDEEKTYELL